VKPIVQKHHIIYENKEHKQKEEVVRIYKGEHWAITQLQRRVKISKGFIKSLKYWILMNEDKAVELNE